MSEVVLDASALLALIRAEPGAEHVHAVLDKALMSTVNLSEVVSKLVDHGVPADQVESDLGELGLHVLPFDETQAYAAGKIRSATKKSGLSLGDRACLALGVTRRCSVLTTDRAWKSLKLGIPVSVIR